ncbi:hypothetical protein PWT90_02578 [Aphanocladium album]|nr:hypothetical protein PWT90_02578 [Aphanocladium album]
MMDDVVGLVMVQIISNLGDSKASISAVTIVRPLMVSIAFAVCAPIICIFIIKPMTLWLNEKRRDSPTGCLNKLLTKTNTAWIIHTLTLVGLIAGSTYAGTSNLFASYIAGACISWWDAGIPHPELETCVSEPVQVEGASRAEHNRTVEPKTHTTEPPNLLGIYVFNRYYKQPLDKVLRPFFFASIGFSIPITEMFSGPIVWKGIVYTILMALGKIACGLWLLRLPSLPSFPFNIAKSLKSIKCIAPHFRGRAPKATVPARNAVNATQPNSSGDSAPIESEQNSTTQRGATHLEPTNSKPRSLYPASILGCAMAARGEIGFVISSIAESNGIYSASQRNGKSSDNFLIITWAIVLCTILGPLAVGLLVRRVKHLQRGLKKQGKVVREDVLGAWGVS